jgi:hypothetical protein
MHDDGTLGKHFIEVSVFSTKLNDMGYFGFSLICSTAQLRKPTRLSIWTNCGEKDTSCTPLYIIHFCIVVNIGFSTSWIGIFPSGVPGIFFAKPCSNHFWLDLRSTLQWTRHTNFSNMHLFNVRSGLRQA